MILDLHRLPILETERLRLEPLTAADVDLIFPIMGEVEVMSYWDVPEADDPDLVAGVIQGHVEAMEAGRSLQWTMRTLADAEFVGCCGLTDVDRRHRRAEVAVVLKREVWGQDYAFEALSSVVAYAAGSGLRRLAARTHLGNRRSEAPLQRLGFKEEGLLRGHILKDGERRDCRLFGLLL